MNTVRQTNCKYEAHGWVTFDPAAQYCQHWNVRVQFWTCIWDAPGRWWIYACTSLGWQGKKATLTTIFYNSTWQVEQTYSVSYMLHVVRLKYMHQHNEFTTYSIFCLDSLVCNQRHMGYTVSLQSSNQLSFEGFKWKCFEDQVRSNCRHFDAHSTTQDNKVQVSRHTSIFWADLFATQHAHSGAFPGMCLKAQLHVHVGLKGIQAEEYLAIH